MELYPALLTTFRRFGDPARTARSLMGLALAYEARGRYKEAIRRYRESLTLMRRVGNRKDEAAILNHLAFIHEAAARPAQAMRFWCEGLSVSRKRKDMKGSENFCLMIRWVRKTRPDLSCAGDEAEGSEGSAVSSCSKVSPAQAPLVLQPF